MLLSGKYKLKTAGEKAGIFLAVFKSKLKLNEVSSDKSTCSAVGIGERANCSGYWDEKET
jgi:hypothetical protein